MLHTITAFLPLTVLLVLALLTKKMAESMTAATLLAMLILHKGNILSGTIDDFYETLSDGSFQFCIILMMAFGGVIELFQKSGGLMGFGNFVSKFAAGKHKPLVLSWIMSVLMFPDEYLNSITVSFSMRDITDRNGISREHLAFQVHAMACCICVLLPFTSWIGFSLSLISDFDMGFTDYVKAIPMMIYPILLMVLCLLLALGWAPKVGVLKTAEERIRAGTGVSSGKDHGSLVDVSDNSDMTATSPLNALVPIIALIIGVLAFDNDLIHGLFIALVVQFAMYTLQKIMTVSGFFETFFAGAKSMTTLTIVLFFGFTLSKANKELGFFDIVIGGVGGSIPGFLLPAIAFLLTGFCVFAIGGCWVVMLITVPLFIPMGIAAGVSSTLILAAVLSGITMGYGLCLYGDTVFMTTLGTGVSNITVIKSTLPYGIALIIISVIGFTALAFAL